MAQTKRQLKAAGKKGAQTRKRNILMAEGFAIEEIDRRRLDKRSFESHEIKVLREHRKAGIVEGEARFSHIRAPQQRREAAIQYAANLTDREFRARRQRETRLHAEGFTPEEIRDKKLETIPFRNPALRIIRRRRKAAVVREISGLLPKGQKRQAYRLFRERGSLFLQARRIAASQDEAALNRMGKDYPYRLLDLYALGV